MKKGRNSGNTYRFMSSRYHGVGEEQEKDLSLTLMIEMLQPKLEPYILFNVSR